MGSDLYLTELIDIYIVWNIFRDLSLGAGKSSALRGAPKLPTGSKNILGDSDKKKKFTPNLNVQRKEAPKPVVAKDASSSNDQNSGWKRPTSKPGRPERPKPNLIQVSGAVFSEGVGSDSNVKKSWGSRSSSSDRDSKKAMERPKMNLNAVYDKVEEEKKLKELLRDDFIDDLKTGHLVPVQLPMISTGKVFEDVKVKADPDKPEEITRSVKSKKTNVILDSDDDEDEATIGAYTRSSTETKNDKDEKSDLTIKDLISDQRGELLFFQLPDHLPNQTNVKQEEKSKNVLSGLPEGYLGKLQIRKSGKAQLWINSTVFDIEVGTQVGFLQELCVVNANPTLSNEFQKGTMTNLGRVRNRVVTSPAWKELFGAQALDQSSSDDESADE